MKKTISILLFSVALVSVVAYGVMSYFVDDEQEKHITDRDFVLEAEIVSPDRQTAILIYHYDAGAFGDGKYCYAVTPVAYSNLNLEKFELPDGYEAKGWSEQNELLVEKFEPYYYRQKLGDLKTGDTFNGVEVRLLEASPGESGRKR